ncbi:hypothetical protein HY636_06005 [Candidatus Woesearchaeota archaeon]|nr:hypothetical protein [Candidatus Woesearchaeota archaeon]
MTQTSIFTKAFEDISALVWRETARQTPWQLFEKESEEELTEDQRKLIPEGLGNQIRYELETSAFEMRFSSLYQPFESIALHEFLYFNFGKVQKSLAGMLDASPFDDGLGELMFEFGKYGDSHKPYVYMKSENLDFWTNGREGFSQHGDAMMQDLLAQKDKIGSISGLTDTDRELLRTTFETLEDKYKSKEIDIIGWYD